MLLLSNMLKLRLVLNVKAVEALHEFLLFSNTKRATDRCRTQKKNRFYQNAADAIMHIPNVANGVLN